MLVILPRTRRFVLSSPPPPTHNHHNHQIYPGCLSFVPRLQPLTKLRSASSSLSTSRPAKLRRTSLSLLSRRTICRRTGSPCNYQEVSSLRRTPLVLTHLRIAFLTAILPGRNMHQCMRAASNMLDIELDYPILPNLKKRKSASDLLSDPSAKRVASMTPIQYQPRPSPRPQVQTPPLAPQPTPQIHPQPSIPPRAVSIQPRPAPEAKSSPAEGYGVFQSKTPSNGYSVFQSNPMARKRGRPSKAEKEAQARASSSSYTTSIHVPISPKPAIQPAQGSPALPLAAPPPSYTTPAHYTSSELSDSRVPRGGSTSENAQPRGLPQGYTEHPTSGNMVKSEKSPSIGNLVTSDPPPTEQRSTPRPLVGPPSRDPPPVPNSA